MTNKLTIGLNFYSKDERRMDLKELSKKVQDIENWKINHTIGDIEIQISSHRDGAIIEDLGNIFYYRTFKKDHISPKELKSLWDESMRLIKELNLDVKYEDKIRISFHSENAIGVYKENKQSVKNFSQKILHNFSLRCRGDEKSILATVTPIPEVVPLKILQ